MKLVLKGNNKNTRMISFSYSLVFIVNFEQISHHTFVGFFADLNQVITGWGGKGPPDIPVQILLLFFSWVLVKV